MGWYEVDLPRGLSGLVYGQTRVFGRVSTAVEQKTRDPALWGSIVEWDVAYRILISTANIAICEGLREAAVLAAVETFEIMNDRPPTPAERQQLTDEALRNCDESGTPQQNVDGVFNHERMHVIAIASCIAFDAHAGELRRLLDVLHAALFQNAQAAEGFAAGWRLMFMYRLRALVARASGHDGAGIAAGMGGLTGAILPALGHGIKPPEGLPVAAGPAPARTGAQAEWNAEEQALLGAGYGDLAAP